MTLNLLTFNNYYNRIIKKFNSVNDYISNSTSQYSIEKYNFNPNDDISTSIVVNISPFQKYPKNGFDYLVCSSDETNEIISRWFIIEVVRLRASQYKLSLYRDTIADYYNEVVNNATCFIEKATLPIDNPLIFNSENITFNQIRNPPTPLFDKSNCPWIVGYIPRDSITQDTEVSVTVPITDTPDYEVSNISNWNYYRYVNGRAIHYREPILKCRYKYTKAAGNTTWDRYQCTGVVNQFKNTIDIERSKVYGGTAFSPVWDDTYDIWNNNPLESTNQAFEDDKEFFSQFLTSGAWKALVNSFEETKYPKITYEQYNEINSMNGKIIHDIENDDYYVINISNNYGEENNTIYSDVNPDMYLMAKTLTNFYYDPTYYTIEDPLPSRNTFYLNEVYWYFNINLTKTAGNIKTTIASNNNRDHCYDSPFDLFCIPYSDNIVLKIGTNEIVTTNRDNILNLTSQLATVLGKGNIYDIQIVPYCPLQSAIDNNKINLFGLNYSPITLNDKIVSALIWCSLSNFTFSLDVYIPKVTSNAIDLKVESLTTTYRLVSPGNTSIFEFDPQKNDGLEKINVFCSYIPYTPYIKLLPEFKGLYNTNSDIYPYQDPRGLVCNKDFSITQLTSEWANYKLNNKNYELIFNRQIQNIDVRNDVQRTKEYISLATNAIQGGISGGVKGMSSGNPALAASGAILGGGASLAGGLIDISLAEQLRDENRDYLIDMYGYNLQNIQAIPFGLGKINTLGPDELHVPILEKYTATDVEKDALRSKLYYNGMTTMVIDSISNYIIIDNPSFIKGKIIRLEDLREDYHILKTISSELERGVFL